MKIKKLKKVLAGMLSAAMVMSTMAVTAFAAGPDTIDTGRKGSLTIHKYTEGSVAGRIGTGTTADEANLPEGAEPLAGAGFTIYKVADVNDLTNYYSTNPTDLPNVNNYVENGAIKAQYADDQVGNEVITGTDGIARFEDLALGFYVVVETTTPDLVTDPMDPFIVSVPMTTVDGDSWLYDVHVYPKNGTTTGEVTLEKKGEDNTSLAGVTFKLEKKNDDGTWSEITKAAGAAGDNTGAALNLVTDNNGKIKVSGLSQGTYRFTEVSLGDSEANGGYILDKNKSYEFTVGHDGNITVSGASGTTITVNNEKPDMEKEVQDRETSEWVNESDYNVGDIIPYKITVNVPANITELKEFVLTDTPTNLTDNVNSIKIKCDEIEIAANAYSAAKEGDDGFKITFNTANMSAYADKELVITYNAVLKESAVTTTAGNPNTATLKYSNEILSGTTPGNPSGTPGSAEIKDNAVVYTFKINVKKTDGSNNPLKDVMFDLYKEAAQDTPDAALGTSDNGLDKTKYWLKVASDLTTNESGEVSVSGLANGIYYLVETKTNEGYNLLKAPVEVTLNIEYVTSMSESWQWEKIEGIWTLVKHEITASSTTFNSKTDAETVYNDNVTTIVNKKGFQLPTTGGAGTLLASLIGILLMGGGAFVFISSRKKKKAE